MRKENRYIKKNKKKAELENKLTQFTEFFFDFSFYIVNLYLSA